MSSDLQQIMIIEPDSLAPTWALADAGCAADRAAVDGTFVEYRSRKAVRTIKAQDEDLKRFARFLADANVTIDVGQLVSDPASWVGVSWGLVRGFVVWQVQHGFALASVNRALSSVKTYVGLAYAAGTIDTETYQKIRHVAGYSHKEGRKIDKERPATRKSTKKASSTTITMVQAQQLKMASDDTPSARRDALLGALLIDHGLRVSEVAALTLTAIDTRRGVMHFYREKVDKEQTHKLTADTLRAALAYLADRGTTPGALLMGSRKGGRLEGSMSMRAINWRVGALGERIGVAGLSPHDLRHYWVTDALASGSDVASVLQAGGWSSLASLQRYINEHQIANAGIKLSS